MKKLCFAFIIMILFSGCSEKGKIDSLIEKKDQLELIKKIDEKIVNKDTSNLIYLCDKILQLDLPKAKLRIETAIFDNSLDANIEDQIISLFEANKKSFNEIETVFDLLQRRQSPKNIKLVMTHPKEKSKPLFENKITLFVRELTDSTFINVRKSNEEFQVISRLIEVHSEKYTLNDSNKFVRLKPLLEKILSVKDQIITLDKPKQPEYKQPTTYSQPSYEQPVYSGCYPIHGEYLSTFKSKNEWNDYPDGIIVMVNGQYLQIAGANKPERGVRYLNGYVEDTGSNITLNRGRNGVPCKVVKIKDRETYADDQRAYQQKLQNAQIDYQRRLASYHTESQAAFNNAQENFAKDTKIYNESLAKYAENMEKNKDNLAQLQSLLKQVTLLVL